MSQEEVDQQTTTAEDEKFKFKAAAFLTGVTGISMLGGFGMTLGMVKKKDVNMFNKGLVGTRELPEAGGALALRALGWGTLYAVSGFAIFCTLMWKLMDVKDLKEFRTKAGNILPRVPKNDPPQGRTEFKGINDLLQYIIDEDNKKKLQQKENLRSGDD